MKHRKTYTPEEIAYIEQHYSDTATCDIAMHIGVSVSKIYHIAFKLGLKKSDAYMKSDNSGRLTKGTVVGYNTFYKKGSEPYNKGKKQEEYMTTEAIERTKATRFKKGQVPTNYLSIGSERITRDGYTEVKIQDPNKWIPKHRMLYEQHYGITIPKGHKCIFLDGNKQNFSIDNLVVESPAMAIQRNTIHRYPEEIKSAIKIHSKLSNTIKKLSHNE